ncbi:MAG: peptidase S41, partial [Gemmatimonadota bacterium]
MAGPLGAQDPRPSFYEPGISPDGSEIAFIHGGDIWTVPTRGGEARLLVAHEEEESRPLYSPDGRWLAFESDRDGTSHIYVHEFATGETRQLTFISTSAVLDGWSRDSEWVWFSSSSHDVAGMSDVFRVRVTGGTPMPVLADRYAGEFWSAPHADGRVAVSVRGRTAWSQWWRNGHSHMDEAEIWIADPRGERPVYRRVSSGGKNQWPMWSPDGGLVFVSDRSGSENLWRVDEDGAGARPLTDFDQGRVLWPSISGDGVVAFERDFRIWTRDPASGRVAPVEIRAVGAVQGPRVEPERLESFTGFTVSPDGEKVVVVSRG